MRPTVPPSRDQFEPVVPRPSRVREWVTALLVGALAVTALTYPLVPRMGNMARYDGDAKFGLWNVAWIGHALLTQPTHLFDANIFFPHTGTLAYSELNLVAGFLGFPGYAITHNPFVALNSAIAIALFLTFVLTWALVRRLTGSAGAGLVAAMGFAFCPNIPSRSGELQLLMTFGIPLVFLAFHRFHERPNVWRSVGLGAALAVCGLACAYYGLFTATALALISLVMADRRRAYWTGLGGALITMLLILAPIVMPYTAARRAVAAPQAAPADRLVEWAARPADFLTSPTFADSWLRPAVQRTLGASTDPMFPGLIVLALAAIAIAKERHRTTIAYLAIAVFALWAAFGPRLLLYTVVAKIIPGMALLRAPVRYGILVSFALAILAGYGARRLARGRIAITAALVLVTAMELAVWGGPGTTPGWTLAPMPVVPQAYRLLASLPPGPVVEFPFPYKRTDFHRHLVPMFWSVFHWQPLVNGYSDVVPQDFRDIAVPINAFPDAASFEILRARQVRYVVWDMNGYEGVSRERLMARFPPYAANLQLLTTDHDVWLYEIRDYPQRTTGF
jgi:hypothetical protein